MASMKKIILYLEWGSILGLLACGLWVFLKLPLESSQGFPQKIMYLHVPTFFSTYLAFLWCLLSALPIFGSVSWCLTKLQRHRRKLVWSFVLYYWRPVPSGGELPGERTGFGMPA